MRLIPSISDHCVEVTKCALELYRDKNQWETEFIPVVSMNNGTSIDWYAAEDTRQLNGLLTDDMRQKTFYLALYSDVEDHHET